MPILNFIYHETEAITGSPLRSDHNTTSSLETNITAIIYFFTVNSYCDVKGTTPLLTEK